VDATGKVLNEFADAVDALNKKSQIELDAADTSMIWTMA